ncbi:MAG TPA: hypothetical protein VFP72_21365, partial [Kineosporiaceae bacterium]|nr:hypothetical protein [Kineosporiaceae bacterium]
MGQARHRAARRRRLEVVGAAAVLLVAGLVGGAVAGTRDPGSGSLTVSGGRAALSASVGRLGDGVASVTFTVPALPTAGGLYLGLDVRDQPGVAAVRGKVRILPDGTLRVGSGTVVAGVEQSFVSAPVPGRLAPGGRLRVDVRVSGADHARAAIRAWVPGATVPPWQYQTFDGTRAVPRSGGVRAWAYLSGSATGSATVTFQGLCTSPDQLPAGPDPDPGSSPAAGTPYGSSPIPGGGP